MTGHWLPYGNICVNRWPGRPRHRRKQALWTFCHSEERRLQHPPHQRHLWVSQCPLVALIQPEMAVTTPGAYEETTRKQELHKTLAVNTRSTLSLRSWRPAISKVHILNKFTNHCSPEFVQKCPVVVFKGRCCVSISLQSTVSAGPLSHAVVGSPGLSCSADNHLDDSLLSAYVLMSVFTNPALQCMDFSEG